MRTVRASKSLLKDSHAISLRHVNLPSVAVVGSDVTHVYIRHVNSYIECAFVRATYCSYPRDM